MRKLFFKWLPLFFCAICIGLSLSSCGGGDDPVEPRPTPGPDPVVPDPVPTVTLSLSVNEIFFDASEGDKQEVNIECNGSWRATNIPSWIEMSGSGNGSSKLTLRTTDRNLSATRSQRVTFSSGDKTVELKITQRAGSDYAENTNVKILDLLELNILNDDKLEYDAVFRLSFDKNCAFYVTVVLDGETASAYTDAQIIDILNDAPKNTRNNGDYIVSWEVEESNKTYYLYAIAYDGNKKHGDFVSTTFRIPSATNKPFVDIINLSVKPGDSNYWQYTTSKSAQCNEYYIWRPSYEMFYQYSSFVAWDFWYLIQQNALDPILNNTTVSTPRRTNEYDENYFDLMTWGMDSKDNLSPIVARYRGRISSTRSLSAESVLNVKEEKPQMISMPFNKEFK